MENGGSVRYAAAAAQRAAPAWWSLGLTNDGTNLLFAGALDGSQAAIPAQQAFRIEPGQIAITVADA